MIDKVYLWLSFSVLLFMLVNCEYESESVKNDEFPPCANVEFFNPFFMSDKLDSIETLLIMQKHSSDYDFIFCNTSGFIKVGSRKDNTSIVGGVYIRPNIDFYAFTKKKEKVYYCLFSQIDLNCEKIGDRYELRVKSYFVNGIYENNKMLNLTFKPFDNYQTIFNLNDLEFNHFYDSLKNELISKKSFAIGNM